MPGRHTPVAWLADRRLARDLRQGHGRDILVIAGPIWLGDNSSVTKQVIERLYACSHLLDAGSTSRTPTTADVPWCSIPAEQRIR